MEAPQPASRPGHLRALCSSDSAWSKSARQCMAGVSCLRRSGTKTSIDATIAGCIYNFGRMPDSAPSFQRHIQALQAAGVVIPPKPILELPRPIIEGQSPHGRAIGGGRGISASHHRLDRRSGGAVFPALRRRGTLRHDARPARGWLHGAAEHGAGHRLDGRTGHLGRARGPRRRVVGAAGLAHPPASERLGLRGARAVARPAGMAGHALHDRSSSAGASRLHDPSHRASFGG